MNRNDFFKKLDLGALEVAIAPKVLAEMPPKVINLNITTAGQLDPIAFHPRSISSNIQVSGKYIEDLGAWWNCDVGYKDSLWSSRTFRSYRDPRTGNTIFIDDKKA